MDLWTGFENSIDVIRGYLNDKPVLHSGAGLRVLLHCAMQVGHVFSYAPVAQQFLRYPAAVALYCMHSVLGQAPIVSLVVLNVLEGGGA